MIAENFQAYTKASNPKRPTDLSVYLVKVPRKKIWAKSLVLKVIINIPSTRLSKYEKVEGERKKYLKIRYN